jgi:hypothetical protein
MMAGKANIDDDGFDEVLPDAPRLTAMARRLWSNHLGGAETPEEVGRALVRAASSGPINWTGVLILRDLGVLVDATGVH